MLDQNDQNRGPALTVFSSPGHRVPPEPSHLLQSWASCPCGEALGSQSCSPSNWNEGLHVLRQLPRVHVDSMLPQNSARPLTHHSEWNPRSLRGGCSTGQRGQRSPQTGQKTEDTRLPYTPSKRTSIPGPPSKQSRFLPRSDRIYEGCFFFSWSRAGTERTLKTLICLQHLQRHFSRNYLLQRGSRGLISAAAEIALIYINFHGLEVANGSPAGAGWG